MSESRLTRRLIRETPVLDDGEPVASAVRRLLDADLRALPVVDSGQRFVGVFGEREFFSALFPGYVGQLSSAAFITAELDETIGRRAAGSRDPVRDFMTTDHVEVPPVASDMHLAETFLHHRVIILPVVENGRVVGVIDRRDFFEALAVDFLGRLSGA